MAWTWDTSVANLIGGAYAGMATGPKPDPGFDCYSLVREVYLRNRPDLDLPPAWEDLAANWATWFEEIDPKGELARGDLLLTPGRDAPHHVMVVIGEKHAIQAARGTGVSLIRYGLMRGMITRAFRPLPAPSNAGVPDGAKIHGDAKDPVTIILAIVSIAATLISTMLLRPKMPGASGEGERRPVFGRVASDAYAGGEIPILFGEREIGGKVIGKTTAAAPDGSGNATLRLLIALTHGGAAGIQSIAGRTSDFDRVASSELPLILLNDQPFANFPGCYAWGRMGTSDQDPIPGFDDIEVLREVGVGGITLRNTGGTERTGSSPSGEVADFATLAEVQSVTIGVTFRKGLFRTTSSGQVEAMAVAWRYRTRTSDVGSGAGSWSTWAVVNLERADQSEVVSSVRVVLATIAKHDIQVERVSVESGDLTKIDEMTWDRVTESLDAELAYPSIALLALELKASDQLTGEPRVTVKCQGIKCRVWDGVSSQDAPEFSRAFTRNPAYQLLEAATNADFGLGGGFNDAKIDLASVVDVAENHCGPTVSTNAGRTRPRFACDWYMESARAGDEQLLAFARCGEFLLAGAAGKLRLIADDARPVAAEVFTDGSLALDDDGVARLEYKREHTTGGLFRPNQVLVQFSNRLAGWRDDAIPWPPDPASDVEGDPLWLGGEDAEPINTEDVQLDGVTDPDQALVHAMRRCKKHRYMSREVEFGTSRELVAVQPGERFDASFSMPAWGKASGRCLGECTASVLRIDRSVTLTPGLAYYAHVSHEDGSVEVRQISPGTMGYVIAGEPLALTSELTDAPSRHAEYVITSDAAKAKPFVCTRVAMGEDGATCTVAGIEYNADIYDDTRDDVTLPNYSDLVDAWTAPGPVRDLRATERIVGEVRQVELFWSQEPVDQQNTASFRVYRRLIGTVTWIKVPTPTITFRSSIVEIRELVGAYQLCVVAVSSTGQSLSPDDPRVPRVLVAIGVSADPSPVPGGVSLDQLGDGTWTLFWTPAAGATGYQVLYGGNTTTRPNVGAEQCLVLARTTLPELTGLRLAPGRAHRFWVRSVNAFDRLSLAAGTVAEASPAAPSGETVHVTHVADLAADGSYTNLFEDPGTIETVLTLDDIADPGVYTSAEIDLSTSAASTIYVRLTTRNRATETWGIDDGLPFVVPSIEADQWGTLDSSGVIGMLMPPYPDNRQGWSIEVRTYSGSWSAWSELDHLAVHAATCSKVQVRVSLNSTDQPYLPALEGVAVVVTR